MSDTTTASASIPLRNRRPQSIGYWLSERSILNHAHIVAGINEVADAGYGIVRIMLRNTNFTHLSPEVVSAVAKAVELASVRGIRVALDCEPHPYPLGVDIGSRYPDAMGTRLVRVEATIIGGQFRAVTEAPRVAAQFAPWDGIEAAFVFRDNVWTRIEVEDLRVDWETRMYRDGDTRLHQDYAENVPVTHAYLCRLSGKISKASDGRVVLYVRFLDRLAIDFWSPSARQYFRDLLQAYRDIPLGGIGWDEPGLNGDWQTYKYGASFAKAFEQRCGYSFADRVYLLDVEGASAESIRFRLDYYDTLNEGLYSAQSDLVEHTQALFGKNALLGTHHTWQGEGGSNDLRAGAVDYFRLADNQDAGYTDCWWWDHKSVCYAYVLGSSLGRLSPTGETEVNTWHAKPTIAQIEYNARLISLFNIVWFNIWVGDTADTCLLNKHYTWPTTVAATRRHDKLQERLVDYKPVVDVAVLHGWESVAALNEERIAGAFKTFSLNCATLFTERSVAFDFIDSRLLASSTIESDTLVNALGHYKVLVLPYAVVLPEEAWQRVGEFIRAGGRTIFTGPPPTFSAEGRPITDEFAEIVSLTKALPVGDYLKSINSWYALPGGRPLFLDCYVPLTDFVSSPLISTENEPNGTRTADGNVVYLTDLDPRERLLDVVAEFAPPRVQCFSDTILWRMFAKPGTTLVVAIARENRTLHGIFEIDGHTVKLTEGVIALVTLSNGVVTIEYM